MLIKSSNESCYVCNKEYIYQNKTSGGIATIEANMSLNDRQNCPSVMPLYADDETYKAEVVFIVPF